MKYFLLLILVTSCGLKKISRVNTKKTVIEYCKENMTSKDYHEIKGGIIKVMQCALKNGDDGFFSFYNSKLNEESLTNREKIQLLRMRGINYLQKQRYDLYRVIRRDFRKYDSDEFLKLEIHYFLLFSMLRKAKRIIQEEGSKLRGTLYLPWFYYLVGDKTKARKLLNQYENKSSDDYKILVAVCNDRSIKMDTRDINKLLEKQKLELINAK